MPDHRAAQIEAHIPGLPRFARALLHGDRERANEDSLERALTGICVERKVIARLALHHPLQSIPQRAASREAVGRAQGVD
jgi:hypothetical protein